jgi:hypothetical protein
MKKNADDAERLKKFRAEHQDEIIGRKLDALLGVRDMEW